MDYQEISYPSPHADTTPAYNGRINLLSNQSKGLTVPTPQRTMGNARFRQEALGGRTEASAVAELFLSAQNLEAVQQGIRYKVWKATRGASVIDRQDDRELRIVMRSIYFQHSRNLPERVVEQVRDLNALVLDWAVPQIMSNLRQYQQYLMDVSTMPVPMERGPLLSMSGSRTLELTSFV